MLVQAIRLQNYRNSINDAWTPFMEWVSMFSVTYLILIPVFLYWSISKRKGLYVLVSYYFCMVITPIVKLTACIYRPWIRDSRILPAGDERYYAPGPRGALILCKEEYAKAIDKAVFPGTQGGPLMHVIAGKAVCLGEAMKPEFKTYAQNIVTNAKALADGLLKRDVKLVSGGTDNHLMLVDLSDMDLTGKVLQNNLDEIHITANKNTVPGEKRSPFQTSGLRLGTPAVTTRGMKAEDMDVIAECIADSIYDFEGTKDASAAKVQALVQKYPLYQ